jgi:hypothetical protein
MLTALPWPLDGKTADLRQNLANARALIRATRPIRQGLPNFVLGRPTRREPRWPRDSENMQTARFMCAAPPAQKPRMVAPATHPDEVPNIAGPK